MDYITNFHEFSILQLFVFFSRQDDLDEFLEVVNNPLKRSPVTKTIKRPYSGSQTRSTQTITKKMKENETRKKPSPPLYDR